MKNSLKHQRRIDNFKRWDLLRRHPELDGNLQIKVCKLAFLTSVHILIVLETGYNLLTLSFEESSAPSQNTRFGNTSLARQLYVHALTYLLRALPSDLTTEENMSLQTAIPKEVVESLQEESNTNESSQNSSLNNPPSLLQRSVAATIIQLFILFQFILPYVKYLLISAYQYDRTHKISEKVLSRGIVTVDTIGKSGLAVTGAIYGMGDGKVGRVLTDAAAWVVEGVTGGVHEGVSEGLVILGAKNGSVGKKK